MLPLLSLLPPIQCHFDWILFTCSHIAKQQRLRDTTASNTALTVYYHNQFACSCARNQPTTAAMPLAHANSTNETERNGWLRSGYQFILSLCSWRIALYSTAHKHTDTHSRAHVNKRQRTGSQVLILAKTARPTEMCECEASVRRFQTNFRI